MCEGLIEKQMYKIDRNHIYSKRLKKKLLSTQYSIIST